MLAPPRTPAAMFTLDESVVVVSAEHITGRLQAVRVRNIGGTRFFHAAGRFKVFNRLMFGSQDKACVKKAIAIVNHITNVRDDNFRGMVGLEQCGKRRRYNRGQPFGRALQIDDVVEITVPAAEGYPERSFSVLASRPGKPLWMEITSDTLEWLRKAAISMGADVVAEGADDQNVDENAHDGAAPDEGSVAGGDAAPHGHSSGVELSDSDRDVGSPGEHPEDSIVEAQSGIEQAAPEGGA